MQVALASWWRIFFFQKRLNLSKYFLALKKENNWGKHSIPNFIDVIPSLLLREMRRWNAGKGVPTTKGKGITITGTTFPRKKSTVKKKKNRLWRKNNTYAPRRNCNDFLASSSRLFDRSQLGVSGMKYIAPKRRAGKALKIQANTFHGTKAPIT